MPSTHLGLPADPADKKITDTDLTMEQAMSMIMTGGAVGPECIRFTQPALESGEAAPLI